MLLRGRVDFAEDEGVAEAQGAVEEDFDPVGAFFLEFGVHEGLDAGGGVGGVVELDGDVLAFDDGLAVGGDDAGALMECPLPAAPAVDDADAVEARGDLLRGEAVEDADEHELAVALLADVVAEETGL